MATATAVTFASSLLLLPNTAAQFGQGWLNAIVASIGRGRDGLTSLSCIAPVETALRSCAAGLNAYAYS